MRSYFQVKNCFSHSLSLYEEYEAFLVKGKKMLIFAT